MTFGKNYVFWKEVALVHSLGRIATSPKIFSHDYYEVVLLEVFTKWFFTELCVYILYSPMALEHVAQLSTFKQFCLKKSILGIEWKIFWDF